MTDKEIDKILDKFYIDKLKKSQFGSFMYPNGLTVGDDIGYRSRRIEKGLGERPTEIPVPIKSRFDILDLGEKNE